LITKLSESGRKGVVANLPYVNNLPHFTTVPHNPLTPKTVIRSISGSFISPIMYFS